ncbi:hypothetical protein BDW74DRAFT_173965 [Aspergillus multicolor]|uniref:uncharacterized protein n=1 Tax=Aspergillus multicolor TaxID=41759 RepID=UPI003CCD1676
MADIPALDEFAQTRGADDLFDDEIIPVPAKEQQTIIEPEPQLQPQLEPEPESQSQSQSQQVASEKDTADRDRQATSPPVHSDTAPRSRGGERRGRGRGRGGRGRGARESGPRESGSGLGSGPRRPNWALNDPGETGVESEAQPQRETKAEEKTVDTSETTETGEEVSRAQTQEDTAAPEAPRVPAVRGDRSATGGVKKPKLTEEELSRRIAAAREKSAKVAAAHARAEADQASFMEREKVAEKKRREERANRKVMDSERERNRLRKMEAMNGREWDADKPEEQSGRGGRGGYRRGMHGGVSGYTRRGAEEYHSQSQSQGSEEVEEDSQHGSEYGYRGRGRGRGRGGRGRGGHRGERAEPSQEKAAPPTPVISNEEEFPSLPGGEKKPSVPASIKTPDLLSPISGGGGTWADQVEGDEK